MATYGWVTDTDADAYFALRLGADKWTNAGAKKGPALQTAYNQLSTLREYIFPDTPDDKMKMMQYEQALFLLQQEKAIDQRLALKAQGVKSFGVSQASIGEEYDLTRKGIALASMVQSLLTDYRNATAGGFFMGTAYRTDQRRGYDDCIDCADCDKG